MSVPCSCAYVGLYNCGQQLAEQSGERLNNIRNVFISLTATAGDFIRAGEYYTSVRDGMLNKTECARVHGPVQGL